MLEKDCGITERIFEGPKAKALFKHKYSDFIVKEISLNDEISTATDTVIHPDCHQKEESEPEPNINDILNPDQISSLDQLLSKESNVDEISWPISDKEQRKLIHQVLRSHYNGKLVSDYSNGNLIIQARHKKSKTDIRNSQVNRYSVLKFVMTKENVDTLEAIETISYHLHVKSKEFSFSGTKDKRGITSQFVTAKWMTPEKLAGFNKIHLKHKIKITDIKPATEMLQLGDLKGNYFEVILRDLKDKENSPAGLFSLKINGFINYFGLQRFGHSGTHLVGAALLSRDWSKAISLIMASSGLQDKWMTGEKREMLNSLPKRCVAERKILLHLDQNGENDLQGAINAISRELRLMYLHALQSWVWNRVASRRMSLPPEKRYNVKIGIDLIEAKDGAIKLADECDSIHQVVLPLPGYNVKYTEELKKDYEEALMELNLSLDCFREEKKNEEERQGRRGGGGSFLDLAGGYRKLLCRPLNMTHHYLYYDDSDIEIFDTAKQKPSYNFIGLKLCFALPASSYATMLIRDVIDF